MGNSILKKRRLVRRRLKIERGPCSPELTAMHLLHTRGNTPQVPSDCCELDGIELGLRLQYLSSTRVDFPLNTAYVVCISISRGIDDSKGYEPCFTFAQNATLKM